MKRLNLLITGLLASACFAAAPAATKTAKAADTESPRNVVAIMRLHGELQEAPPSVEFSFSGEQKRTLFNLLERLKKAKKDEQLKAVVLVFDEPQIGLAQIQEIRSALKDLRAADKDVYAYIESAHAGPYMLATAASKIVMVPTGDLSVIGLNAESPYFKNLMDKIGVKADIEHIGAFKSAGEPFTRTGPSPEAKSQTEALLKDVFDQMVDTIAEGRQLGADEVRRIIDSGPMTAKAALEAKLIDEVAYAENFTASLKKRYGPEVTFNHDYGAKKGPELDFSNIFSMFKSFGELMAEARSTGKTSIAVVYVDGMIVTGKAEEGIFGDSGQAASTTLRRTLAKAMEDDNIKAVVLRVDSPGGSALASEIIWHATQEVKAKKPLVVSMGNVAASGGYYVSTGAATIFAEPGTITGSIGVIGGKLVTTGLWDWIGITFDQTKMGANADLYSTGKPFTDEQRVIVRKLMEEIYGEFKSRVTQGRGKKLKKDLEELAGGRVYTGSQALKLGLVDKLGGLQDAIKQAASEANISEYEVKQLPEPRNFMDALVEGLTGEKKDKDSPQISIDAAPAAGFGWSLQAPAIRDFLPMLRKADPERFKTVLRSLMRIELLAQEGVLLVTPAEINVR